MYVNLWSVYQTLGWESTCRSRGHGTTLVYFLRPLGNAKNSGVQKWIWNMVSHPFPRNSRLAVEHGLRQEYENMRDEKKIYGSPNSLGGSQVQDPPISGFATAIPQGAPLSTEHFKNDDSALDGLQSHSEYLLIIVVFLFLRDMGRGLFSILLVSGHLLLQKTGTFGLGSPPSPE